MVILDRVYQQKRPRIDDCQTTPEQDWEACLKSEINIGVSRAVTDSVYSTVTSGSPTPQTSWKTFCVGRETGWLSRCATIVASSFHHGGGKVSLEYSWQSCFRFVCALGVRQLFISAIVRLFEIVYHTPEQQGRSILRHGGIKGLMCGSCGSRSCCYGACMQVLNVHRSWIFGEKCRT